MRRTSLLTNRVVLGMLAFFIAVAFWQFRVREQYQPFYKEGVVDYQQAQYSDALEKFNRAYTISPNALDVILMMGWTNLKLRRFTEAEYFFNRALAIDPHTDEARLGAGFAALETGRGTLDLEVLKALMAKRGNDPGVRLLVAGALVRVGRDLEAAAIYSGLQNDKDYGRAARAALDEMFGLQGFNDPIPNHLAALSHPAQTQLRYRAGEGALWRRAGADWQKFYVTGVNLGSAAPGFYPGAPPLAGGTYASWLLLARQLNANTVRVYGLMPPGFYRAFRHHVADGGKLTLFQQIAIDDPPGNDLFDPSYVEGVKEEIRRVVDALHGRAQVGPRPGRASGVYDSDLSAQVSGILFGRELDAVVVAQTNLSSPSKRSYEGKYISVSEALPAQVWVAEMLDYMVSYETETYNWQHPVAFVNWPRLDPLYHPTESGRTNAAAIDEAKFRMKPGLQAGLFASYQIYLHNPEFFTLDPTYANARDSQGVNPMAAYLRDLRAHIPYPLVVTEYGVSSAMGILDFLPNNWNYGGHSEEEQAKILSRLTGTVRDSGCAGGLVFELLDEWYPFDRLYMDFEDPRERATLWLNELDPRKRYGLVGYRTSKWRLFAGDAAAWQKEAVLYRGERGPAEAGLRRVQAATDEAFLYFRLEAPCLDCTARPGARLVPEKTGYAIALSTAPSQAGFKKLPFGNLSVASGANFLLYLGDPASGRLLVAENYNPFGVGPDGKLIEKGPLVPALQETGSFQELQFPLHPRRTGRGGVNYPEQRFNASVLRYGNGDPVSSDFDSLAEWYYEPRSKAILVRIPWGKILVTDPSSRRVFYGLDDAQVVKSAPSTVLEVSAYTLKGARAADLNAMSVVESFPAAAGGEVKGPQRLAWSTWNAVNPETYLKEAYYETRDTFSDNGRAGTAVAGGRLESPEIRKTKKPSGNSRPR